MFMENARVATESTADTADKHKVFFVFIAVIASRTEVNRWRSRKEHNKLQGNF